MPVKQGIRMFGERAVMAVLSELGQINSKEVLDPMYIADLMEEQKKAALDTITLIKESGVVRSKAEL